MLNVSLYKTANLMSSTNYYPRRMINFFAERAPERVRTAFRNLYNEDLDLIDRIEEFKREMKAINVEFQIKDNDYQDLRAAAVYLSLRYPDLYYFYKYKMVVGFVPLIDYPVEPVAGRTHNILEFQSMCDIIRAEILRDPDLLELHRTRIGQNEYQDNAFHILTQDVIYAAVKHLNIFRQPLGQTKASSRLTFTKGELNPSLWKPTLKGRFKNYIENEKEKKRIGDLGELLVMQYEQEKLSEWGLKKKPEHTSKKEGDGLGYDILSYDRQENPIYIEVKTTTGRKNTPFYITANEKARSEVDSRKFFLYRLYEFKEEHNTAKCRIRGGNLSELCINPVLYRVVVEK